MDRLLVVLLAVACPSLAAAQAEDSPPAEGVDSKGSPSSEDAEARSLFDAGQTAYDSGRYEAALGYFERAYELSQRPALLFNIGSTAERLRQDQKAIEAYRAYLEALPNAGNRSAVVARIEILRGHQTNASEPTAGTQPASTPPPLVSTPATPRPSDDGSGANPWGIRLLIGASATLALTAGAFIWWLDRTDAVDQCDLPDRFCENRDTLDTQQTLALVSWITGAALTAGAAVTGLVLLSQNEDATAASFSCGPGAMSVNCGGRF